jgi:hypothetical protein
LIEQLRNARNVFATVLIVAAAALLIILRGQPSVWNSMQPATCLPDRCFCEVAHDQLVRQPANALSGLSFVGIGLFALIRRRRKHVHTLVDSNRPDPTEYLLATAAVILGIGTVFYHASLTFVGQTLDLFGMYLLVTMVALAIAARAGLLSVRMLTVLGVGINAFLLLVLIVAPEYRRIVFAALVTIVVALESSVGRRAERRDRRMFWAALAAVAGGFAMWVLDYTRVACSPMSWVQGHAVWHLCGAAAVWLTLRYYTGAVQNQSTA